MPLKKHFLYMFGDEFWYSAPNLDILNRADIDLYAKPDGEEKPIIWHLAHIIHKEEVHVGHFLQQPKRKLLHPELNALLMTAQDIEDIKKLIPKPSELVQWHNQVRKATRDFICGLSEEDFFFAATNSPNNLSVIDWLSITQIHTGVHLGRIDAIIKSRQ